MRPALVAAEQVAYVRRWHVTRDRSVPNMTPKLRVFKEADALDRWCIGKLDPSFLRTGSAHRLHQRLPKSKLIIVEEAGHSETEPGITRALLEAVAAFE